LNGNFVVFGNKRQKTPKISSPTAQAKNKRQSFQMSSHQLQ
jgi:hypothetical protein